MHPYLIRQSADIPSLPRVHSPGRIIARFMAVVLLLLSISPSASAHDDRKGKEEEEDGSGSFYETSVSLGVQGLGTTEIPAIVSGENVYLSISDVFGYLKIRNNVSKGADSVSGFFITEQASYCIDKANNRIQYQGKQIELGTDDLMHAASGLFMNTAVFGPVFGLDCKFNFRNLSASMCSKQELPAIREMKQELMHSNINHLKGEQIADTVIGRSYPFFKLGMADWSIIATQRLKKANDTRLNLTLGAALAGGEAMISLNYNDYFLRQIPETRDTGNVIRLFDRRQQYYRWRFVNNNNPLLRQVVAGKLFTQSIASIFAPVVGVQFTNTPSTYRRSFGTYTLSNVTEPGWTVELYVNNELVDYKKADASGFFTFQVPLVYGNSLVKLRFYGPWGEERTREEHISIPFNFLPKGSFEYTVNAGMVEDDANSKFARAVFSYGATGHLTVGGGMEYLSSITSGKTLPFVNASWRIGSSLLFSGDYSHGVRARGIMTYRTPSNLLIEANYTRYKSGQTAIIYNYLEDRKIAVSKSFTGRHFALFSRLMVNQIILPETKYATAEWLMSGAVHGIATSLTTYAVVTQPSSPYVYSNLALTFRLPERLTLTPQLQYGYTENKVISMKCEAGKYLFRHGYMNIAYERNLRSSFSNVIVGFRYDLSFSQVALSAASSNRITTFVQSARGSLIYDGSQGHLEAANHPGVGRGGLVIIPFLDLNNNGHQDKGEPRVEGLQIGLANGRVSRSSHDTTVRVLDLEPYTNYFIDLSRSNFEQVAWQVRKKKISVMVDPNVLKSVEVPVVVMGELSGTIYLKDHDRQAGLGRITICIYRPDGTEAARVLTEADGYFSYTGLEPGCYVASADAVQLKKLGFKSIPGSISFNITASTDGDVVQGKEFILERVPENSDR